MNKRLSKVTNKPINICADYLRPPLEWSKLALSNFRIKGLGSI